MGIDHHTTLQDCNKTFPELVVNLGNLRYDALAEFLRLLAAKLESDAAADESKGRLRLAAKLRSSAKKIGEASTDIQGAWHICEPHMPEL